MKNGKLKLISTLALGVNLAGLACPAQAEESFVAYYDPSSSISLGAGFNWDSPRQAFLDCIESDGERNVDTRGAIRTEFSVSMVNSRKELYEQLRISASASVRSLMYSGSASFNSLDAYSFGSDSLVWMVKAESDYGRYVLKNPRLKPQYQALIDRRQHQRFADACGTHFVQQERRMTQIAAIFSIENVSESRLRELETSFKASVSSGFFNADASASYSSFFRAASMTSQVRISIFAIGGGGVTELSDVILYTGNLNKIQETLAKYIKSMTADKAMPIEYVAGSMRAFGYAESSGLAAYHRERTLSQIFYRYKDAEIVLTRLNQILSSSGSEIYSFLSGEDRADLEHNAEEHGQYLAALFSAAEACQADARNCRIPTASPAPVKWPLGRADSCEKLRLLGVLAGAYGSEKLSQLREYGMAPVFREDQAPQSGLVGTAFCKAR